MNLRKLLFLASCFLLKRAAEFMLLFSVGLAIAIFIGDTEASSAIWLVLATFALTPLLEAAYAIVRKEGYSSFRVGNDSEPIAQPKRII